MMIQANNALPIKINAYRVIHLICPKATARTKNVIRPVKVAMYGPRLPENHKPANWRPTSMIVKLTQVCFRAVPASASVAGIAITM